ncbi:MAG: hypothetical protein ACE5NG_11345 [bacterium]
MHLLMYGGFKNEKDNFCSLLCFGTLSLITMGYVARPAFATLIARMDTEKLTLTASHIVIGRVEHLRCGWGADGLIFTDAKIVLQQNIKGALTEKEITVTHLGGEVGHKSMRLLGAPTFEKDERVLLFLVPAGKYYPAGKNKFVVLGAFQGKNTIKNNQVLEKKKPLEAFVKEIKTVIRKQMQK